MSKNNETKPLKQPAVMRSVADIEKRLNTAKEGLDYWQREQILAREESYKRMCYEQIDFFRGEINILDWVLGCDC